MGHSHQYNGSATEISRSKLNYSHALYSLYTTLEVRSWSAREITGHWSGKKN